MLMDFSLALVHLELSVNQAKSRSLDDLLVVPSARAQRLLHLLVRTGAVIRRDFAVVRAVVVPVLVLAAFTWTCVSLDQQVLSWY